MPIKKCPDISPDFNDTSTELRLVEDQDQITLNTRRWYNICSSEGTKIGHVCITFFQDNASRKEAEVSEVRIFAERNDYGTKLYTHLGEVLKKEGYTLISCAVNEASTRLWERLVRIGIARKTPEGSYELI